MSEECRCGKDCSLCDECGSPRCECHCDYYEEDQSDEDEEW